MDNKKLDFWQTKSQDEIDYAFDLALSIAMVIEFIIVVGIGILLRKYVSMFWSDVWVFSMYALTLKISIDTTAKSLKQKVIDMIRSENKTNENASKEEKIG